MDSGTKIYATKVGDMYGTGDKWCGVELTIVNYPPTPKAMGWASWVKAPSNEGNVP